MRVVLPNSHNFSTFFIVFEWGRIFESEMDKLEVTCNAEVVGI